MATTIIILTPVRPTASTDLTGLQVECLSAPAHGMAGAAVGAGAVGVAALIVTEGSGAAGSSVAVDLMAHEALVVDAVLHGVRRAASMEVADSMAARCTVAAGSMVVAVSTLEEASTAAEVEDSMEVVDTVAEADMAADTGKFARGLI
jgi:hypothetical protein